MLDTYYKSAHIVNFADRYAIVDSLIGQAIPIRNSDDSCLSIYFPTINVENGYPELSAPSVISNFGVDEKSWGKVNEYNNLNHLFPLDAWISAVLVVCYSRERNHLVSSHNIEKMARKLVHALQIINPESIRISQDDFYNSICDISLSVDISDEGQAIPVIKTQSIIDDSNGHLSFADIKKGVRNLDKVISAPYELLDNARVNLSQRDTRSAVLNCATSIEIMLKRRVIAFLESSTIPQNVRDYIINKSDGYSKLIDISKHFSLPIEGMSNVKQLVMEKRNRVIHGGYVPTHEEARRAYICTREVLVTMEQPMFE